jgi:hypothetical protein
LTIDDRRLPIFDLGTSGFSLRSLLSKSKISNQQSSFINPDTQSPILFQNRHPSKPADLGKKVKFRVLIPHTP